MSRTRWTPATSNTKPIWSISPTKSIGTARTDTLLVPNPTFKVGVTNNADVEVNVPFAGVHTYGTAAPSNTLWGIGDTFVRSKINLWGNDGGNTAAAIIPYVKAPSAPIGIGNGAVEGGLIGPVAFSLPNSFMLLLVPEIDVLKDSLGRRLSRQLRL